MEDTIYRRATESTEYLRSRVPVSLSSPQIGIICGSGLGELVNSIRSDRNSFTISYGQIPHFPESTVPGHAGKLVFGVLDRTEHTVVLMVGRLHFYEGHTMQDTVFPIRVIKLLGANTLIVTNASGGLNAEFEVGDLMVLSDHLNLAGLSGIHPLRGPNVEEFGVRFPPLSDAYDLDLRRRAHRAWKMIMMPSGERRKLHEGVYAFVGGPSYETRAECRMLRALGADAVGMSTVPEVIVARHAGIRVLALSLVTNLSVLEAGPAGNDPAISQSNEALLTASQAMGKASHEEVLEAGRQAASTLQLLVLQIVADM